MKINEAAKLTGLTVRALQYYDKIGLLKPKINSSGYRIYDENSLDSLRQIMFFKELDFSLSEIKDMISSPNYNREEALKKQRELLLQKRERLDSIIELLNDNIQGDKNMNTKESFKKFDKSKIESHKKEYADEVKSRWGDTDAYRESEEKTAGYSDEKWADVTERGNDILKRFGECRRLSPESDEAQSLVREWQSHITDSFYNCTDEILYGLSQMYVYDERFKANIDKNGEGTAEFMSAAIEAYCKK